MVTKELNKLKRLSVFQIKALALVFMTIDHLAAFELVPQAIAAPMRILGRIAAPLFLFAVVEGVRHTGSKGGYLFRLYAFGALIQLANTLYERVFFRGQIFAPGNIIPTFVFLVFFVICAERLIAAVKNKRFMRGAGYLFVMFIPFAAAAAYLFINRRQLTAFYEISAWARIIVPNILSIPYSFGFVLLGVFWYFCGRNAYSCLALLVLSLLSRFIDAVKVIEVMNRVQYMPFNFFELFLETQWCMVFAVPFIFLYSGKKGAGGKRLFYAYYPLHQYALLIVKIFLKI